VLAWLLAVHIQPLIHNVEHRNDHSHGPEAHHHDHDHDSEHDLPAVPISDEHGSGSTLHYAAAVAAAPVFTVPPPTFLVDRAPNENPHHVAERRSSPPISRGPPSSLQLV
jgi:hypothetical protein